MSETKRAKALRLKLEAVGYTQVRVWWEPIGMAMEMCGPSGGWMAESDQGLWPLGLSFYEASAWIVANGVK